MGFFGTASELDQRSLQLQRRLWMIQLFNPCWPQRHAALAQPPGPTARTAEGVAHQYAERCGAAIQITISWPLRDRRSQRWIREQNTVPLPSKMPSSAGTGDAGTNDGDGGDQLRAFSGITAA